MADVERSLSGACEGTARRGAGPPKVGKKDWAELRRTEGSGQIEALAPCWAVVDAEWATAEVVTCGFPPRRSVKSRQNSKQFGCGAV